MKTLNIFVFRVVQIIKFFMYPAQDVGFFHEPKSGEFFESHKSRYREACLAPLASRTGPRLYREYMSKTAQNDA
jgi:hypothetical protein